MPFTIDFKGKCVVVSGGNRGIGLALSQEIAAAGASVAILYHSSKDAPQQAENIGKQYGVKCKAWQCDVGNQELVKSTFKNIDKELGPITGLVANAGISVVKDALEYTSADFDKVYHTNVLGVFHTAQAAAQLWKDSGYKQGSIVIIASMSSQIFNLGINQCFYNSSKAAVAHVGKCLAVEWAPLSIRVNIVSPGYVETDQTSHMPKDLRDMQAGIVPLKRFAKPHEMAGQTIFLLSDHASYMTGAECFVDGGNLVV